MGALSYGFKAVIAAVFALGLMASLSMSASALPPPVEQGRPVTQCRIPYELRPGERAVVQCQARRPLTGDEVAVVRTRHEDADAAVIEVLPAGVVVAITNRSAKVVRGNALVSTF